MTATDGHTRFDQTPGDVLWVAFGLMLGTVLLSVAEWLYEGLEDALDVEFGGDGD